MAAHAAIGLATARRDDQFQTALASRDIIGQAKGMIMERFGVDAPAAFNLLVSLSQEKNTPLHLIAAQLVDAARPPG
ncbi:ANTAR domain-containing protein [Mycolicibacterium novocastrense]|uniref:GAF/ANTAR domain-containing protein n=1 Tax=Mycolicibacterium novocastrense TaxID=59813 RepID=A0ABQ0KFA4_MYCNV|nr:ANTAR domain-containing protein [Mycolicibacterium novocastrense]GAT08186.1 GAF/ANTAR domain-containing protein [Mycolicibacterium novocastrense]